jgi:hypothetical protein
MAENKAEGFRRARLGDLRKLFRDRYGPELPDDDAGRSDLIELLCPISLGQKAKKKMIHAVEVYAPWMSVIEGRGIIDHVDRLPIYERKVAGEILGERLRLTNAGRERLGIRTIKPFDLSAAQLAEQRKAKKRTRMKIKRRKAGAKSRVEYLATSLSRSEPWIAEGISRRTWERRRAKAVASPCQDLNLRCRKSVPHKYLIAGHTLATPAPPEKPKGYQANGVAQAEAKQPRQVSVAQTHEPPPRSSGHTLATLPEKG